MQRKVLCLSVGCAVGMLSTQALANNWHHYASVGMGLTQTAHQQDVTILNSPAPGEVDRFIFDSTAYLTFQVGLGTERLLKTYQNQMQLSLGGEGVYLLNNNAKGYVLPAVNVGDFSCLNFKYNINSVALLAKANLKQPSLFKNWGGYVDAGLGLGINRFSDYQETIPAGGTTLPLEFPFGDKSRADFAFSVGVGVTHPVGSRFDVSVGYRYINTGKGTFKTSPSQSVNDRLQSGSLGNHLINLVVRI